MKRFLLWANRLWLGSLCVVAPFPSAASEITTDWSGLSWFFGGDLITVAPKILSHPQNQFVQPGAVVELQVKAAGYRLKYEWTRNGELLPNENASTLVLRNVTPEDGGSYRAIISSPTGMLESSEATVVVDCPEVVFFQGLFSSSTIRTRSGFGRGNGLRNVLNSLGPVALGSTSADSAWVTWIAPESGIARITTRGSTFDTCLAVYRGEKTGQLIEIARDDESGGYHTSEVLFNAKAGSAYQIAVDGYGRQMRGHAVLKWEILPSDYSLPENIVLSPNQTLTPGGQILLSASYSVHFSPELQWFRNGNALPNTDPSLLLKEPTAADIGIYKLRISSPDWDFWTGPIEVQYNSEGMQCAAQNKLEDAKQTGLIGIPETSPSANTYSAASSEVMMASSGPTPIWSGYSGGQVFQGSPGKDPYEPHACGVVGGASYWFSYTPPESGILFLNTDGSAFDTVLGVYIDDGSNMGYESLIPVACDNNSGTNGLTSSLSFDATGGIAYYIMVDGVNGAYGLTRLNYRLDAYPTISTIATQTINEDQSTAVLDLVIGDRETDPSSLVLTGTCADTTLVPNANIIFGGSGANRTVQIIPSLYRFGTNTITLTVTDAAGGTKTCQFTLQVVNINHSPKAVLDSYLRLPDRMIYISLSAMLRNDTDLDGDTLTITGVSPRSVYGATVSKGVNFITYSPPLYYNGPDRFTYTISDGKGGTATGNVTIYVSTNGQSIVY